MLADAERERRRAVLLEPVVAEVDGDLAGPEIGVRWREDGDRSGRAALGDHDAARRPQRHQVLVDRAAEAVLLPVVGDVLPGHARPGRGQPTQSAVVLVGHPRLVGGRQHVLLDEVAALEDRVLEPAAEHAELHAGERDLHAGAVGLHLAAGHFRDQHRPLHFVGLARQARLVGDAGRRRRVAAASARRAHVERRVPERLPAELVDHLGGQLHAQAAQRRELLVADPAQARDDAEVGADVVGDRSPGAALLAGLQRLDDDGTLVQPEAEPQFLLALAVPGHGQRGAVGGGGQAGGGAIRRQVAGEGLGRGDGGQSHPRRQDQQNPSAHRRLLARPRAINAALYRGRLGRFRRSLSQGRAGCSPAFQAGAGRGTSTKARLDGPVTRSSRLPTSRECDAPRCPPRTGCRAGPRTRRGGGPMRNGAGRVRVHRRAGRCRAPCR